LRAIRYRAVLRGWAFHPNTRHAGQDQTVLAQRACLWAAARATRPERWSGQPRNWAPVADVWLNPERATGARLIPLSQNDLNMVSCQG
jgi:hypothetical protein